MVYNVARSLTWDLSSLGAFEQKTGVYVNVFSRHLNTFFILLILRLVLCLSVHFVYFQIFLTYTWVTCTVLFLCESKSAKTSTYVVFRKGRNVFVCKHVAIHCNWQSCLLHASSLFLLSLSAFAFRRSYAKLKKLLRMSNSVQPLLEIFVVRRVFLTLHYLIDRNFCDAFDAVCSRCLSLSGVLPICVPFDSLVYLFASAFLFYSNICFQLPGIELEFQLPQP